MSDTAQYETAPEDRIPPIKKLIYGIGAFANNLLADALGRMMFVLNIGLGMSPTLVGALGGLPRLLDALTDPLMGYISDNTRSRWGRRRPYIFLGAILAGIIFALLWQLPRGQSETFYFWFFLIGSLLFFLAYTMYATPWVALGYELTPDYHERTRLMGVQFFIGSTVYLITPYIQGFVAIEWLFSDVVEGAAWLGLIVGVVVILTGIVPALFLRERFKDSGEDDDRPSMSEVMGDFFDGFLQTIKLRPFLKLCIATFLVFNGFMLIATFQYYVIVFYVFEGDVAEGGLWVGHAGLVQQIASLIIIVGITKLAAKIGKRRAFYFAISVSIVGYALKWFCYTPDNKWLMFIPAPLMAFALAGLFTLIPSMVADVVDLDELNTNERREGMFASIFWWVVKLGSSAAIFGGGVLLTSTGFDESLVGPQSVETLTMMRVFDAFIPCVASVVAIWAIASFPITEERAHEIREELEERRGSGGDDAEPQPAA
ncbi:MAG: MFS transporter [Pseudomonadota bacterium]